MAVFGMKPLVFQQFNYSLIYLNSSEILHIDVDLFKENVNTNLYFSACS